jgi:hypothetical protein
MEAKPYKTKAGVTQFLPSLTEAEFRHARDFSGGWCLGCGIDVDGVEPDPGSTPAKAAGSRKFAVWRSCL